MIDAPDRVASAQNDERLFLVRFFRFVFHIRLASSRLHIRFEDQLFQDPALAKKDLIDSTL
ncbi:hypothetical protein KP05_04975 [Cobetia amphilecti]|nr:hypothetical protein KP05_04975 [Cobetia amphilecti]